MGGLVTLVRRGHGVISTFEASSGFCGLLLLSILPTLLLIPAFHPLFLFNWMLLNSGGIQPAWLLAWGLDLRTRK